MLADWDRASEVIYDPSHPVWQNDPYHVAFVHSAFTPSATPLSLQAYAKKVSEWAGCCVVLLWLDLSLMTLLQKRIFHELC